MVPAREEQKMARKFTCKCEGCQAGVTQHTERPVKLKKLDCGIHYGMSAGACRKCAHEAKLMSNPRYRAGLQYSGVPWNAVIGKRL